MIPTISFRPSGRPLFLPPQGLFHPRVPQLLVHPDLVQNIAQAGMIRQAAQSGGAVSPEPPSLADLLDIEHDLHLNPAATLMRHFRVVPIGGTIANGQLTFSPQKRCVPLRIVCADGTAGGLQNLMAGVDTYYAASSTVPAECYSHLAPDTGWLRPILVEPGTTITATSTIANATPIGMWVADLGKNGLITPPLGTPRSIGFGAAGNVPATGSATVSVKPQKDFHIRRLAVNEGGANFAALTLTGFTSEGDPQVLAQSILPMAMFACKAMLAMMDGDTCTGGLEIDLTAANSAGTAGDFVGEIFGDSVE